MRVLAVDDDQVSRMLVERILGRAGFDVTVAECADDAMRLLTEEHFDVLVTDLMMPEADGTGLIQAVRADPRTARTPIVVCSAVADRGSVVEAIQLGIEDYIVKPVRAATLVHKVRSAAAQGPPPVLDDLESVARRLQLANDRAFLEDVLREFVNELDKAVTELRSLLAARDVQGAQVVTVRLVGAAANLGAETIMRTAEELGQETLAGNFDAATENVEELAGMLVDVRRYVASLPVRDAPSTADRAAEPSEKSEVPSDAAEAEGEPHEEPEGPAEPE